MKSSKLAAKLAGPHYFLILDYLENTIRNLVVDIQTEIIAVTVPGHTSDPFDIELSKIYIHLVFIMVVNNTMMQRLMK